MMARSEEAFLIDSEGRQTVIGIGEEHAVLFNDEELKGMRGMTLTHNHPSGVSFSNADLILASTTGMKEIRAVGTDHNGDQWLYRAMPGESGEWPSVGSLRFDYALIDRETFLKYSPDVTAKTLSAQDANTKHQHEVNERLSKALGFDYRRIRL